MPYLQCRNELSLSTQKYYKHNELFVVHVVVTEIKRDSNTYKRKANSLFRNYNVNKYLMLSSVAFLPNKVSKRKDDDDGNSGGPRS